MKREPCEANVEWEARFEVVADSRIEKLCSTKKDTHLINKLWWLFKNEIFFFSFSLYAFFVQTATKFWDVDIH